MEPAAFAVRAILPEQCLCDIPPDLQSLRVAAEGQSWELPVPRQELRASSRACRGSVFGFDRSQFMPGSGHRQLAVVPARPLARFSGSMRIPPLAIQVYRTAEMHGLFTVGASGTLTGFCNFLRTFGLRRAAQGGLISRTEPRTWIASYSQLNSHDSRSRLRACTRHGLPREQGNRDG